MADLIDRDALLQKLKSFINSPDCEWDCGYNTGIAEVIQCAKNSPTVNLCIPCSDNYCKFCDGVSFSEEPFTVITPKDKQVDCIFRFCPNCGRKLSEGDEI